MFDEKILIGHSESWKGYLDTSVLYPKSYEEIKNKWWNGSVSHNAGKRIIHNLIKDFVSVMMHLNLFYVIVGS